MRPVTTQALLDEAAENLRIGRPKEALRLARALARQIADPLQRAAVVSGLLIDAGAELRLPTVVKRGVTMLLVVEQRVPENARSAFKYNLGSGWLARARFEKGVGPATRPSLDEAVSCLDESLRLSYTSSAATNLANALRMQGRVVEALDEYERIVARHPDRHQAVASRGQALEYLYRCTWKHAALLTGALRDYEAAIGLAAHDPVFRRHYERAARRLRAKAPEIPDRKSTPTAYEEWIWSARLALNLCPICRSDTPSAFDIYPLAGALAGGSRRPPLTVPFDLVNALCRSFAAARWQLYKSVAAPPTEPDSLILAGGSPNAVHGLSVGLLMASIGGFYEVMNQVSFGMNSYFGLGHSPRVLLDNVWAIRGSEGLGLPSSRSAIHPRLIRPASVELGALFNLARSFKSGAGRYSELRKLRNRTTHRVVVATDRGAMTSRYFETAEVEALRKSAYDLGRLARAALWYFGAAVHRAERARARRAARRGQLKQNAQGISVRRD